MVPPRSPGGPLHRQLGERRAAARQLRDAAAGRPPAAAQAGRGAAPEGRRAGGRQRGRQARRHAPRGHPGRKAEAARRARAGAGAGEYGPRARRHRHRAAEGSTVNPDGRPRMLLSVLATLVLTVFPLPPWLDVLRPPFLVLAVLYWSINSPRTGGIALGFFAGLTLDVFQGPILGQHALALALVTYIAVREHQRIRSKPAFQQ